MKSLFFSLVALFIFSFSLSSFSQDTTLKVVEYRNKIVLSVSTVFDTLKTENADDIAFFLRTNHYAENVLLKAIKCPGQKIVYKNEKYRDYNEFGTKWRNAEYRYFYIMENGLLHAGSQTVIIGDYFSARFVYIMILWALALGVILGCQKYFNSLWDENTMIIIALINAIFAIAYSWLHNYESDWEVIIFSGIGVFFLALVLGMVAGTIMSEVREDLKTPIWIAYTATMLTTTHAIVVGSSFVAIIVTFAFIVVLETTTFIAVRAIINKVSKKPAPPVVIAE